MTPKKSCLHDANLRLALRLSWNHFNKNTKILKHTLKDTCHNSIPLEKCFHKALEIAYKLCYVIFWFFCLCY